MHKTTIKFADLVFIHWRLHMQSFTKVFFKVCLVIATVVILSCGGGGNNSNTGPGKTVTVNVGDNFFDPASITVNAGTTVMWRNMGGHNHTATSGAPNARSGLFDSGPIATNQTFQFTVSNTGTIVYFCTIHPEMTGTIIVQANSGGGGGYSPTATH